MIVGSTDGPAEYALGDVRAAIAFPDGRLAIADNSTGSIRIYDANGRHVQSVGRSGEGPGEFRFLATMTRTEHDTLVVGDGTLQRITILGPSGDYIRSFRITGAPETNLIRRIEAIDGRHVVLRSSSGRDARTRDDGLSADTVTVWVLNLDSATVRAIGETVDEPWIFKKASGNRVFMRRAPFPAPGYVAAGRGIVAIGTSSEDDIRTFAVDGVEIARMDKVRPMPPVHRADVLRYYHVMFPDPTGFARLRSSGDLDMSLPGMPAFDDLVIDAASNVWVRRYAPPWLTAPSQWDVHEPGGRWLGTVELPTPRPVRWPQRDILEIGHDYVLILLVDSMGVQRVARFGLIKAGSRGPVSTSHVFTLASV